MGSVTARAASRTQGPFRRACRAAAFMGGALVLFFACGESPPPSAPASPGTNPALGACDGRQAGPATTSSCPPAAPWVEPSLLPYVYDFWRVTSMENWAAWSAQIPIAGFRPLWLRPGWPRTRASRVVAYRLGWDGCHLLAGKPSSWKVAQAPRLDASTLPNDAWPSASCWHAIEGDGTFTPSVVLPGAELSESQHDRLLRQLARPESPALFCPGDDVHPSMSFVFYDRAGLPVAEAWLALTRNGACWRTYPGNSKNVTHESLTELLTLSRELGFLVTSSVPKDVAEASERLWRSRQGSGPRIPAFGVAADTPLASLGSTHKRRLCAWSACRGGIAANEQAPRETSEAQQGTPRSRGSELAWEECIARFPRCTAPLDQVLRCQLLAQQSPTFELGEEFASCRVLLPCLWGLEVEDGSHSAPP
jgi:hypothetical protein